MSSLHSFVKLESVYEKNRPKVRGVGDVLVVHKGEGAVEPEVMVLVLLYD